MFVCHRKRIPNIFVPYRKRMNMSTIAIQNHWWREGSVKRELAKAYRRVAFYRTEELAGTKQAVVLSGMRRVGKSTVMFQMIQSLIDRGVDPLDVLYFSFDEGVPTIKELFSAFGEATGKDYQSGPKKYVFLDEVQKLKGWEEQVKLFYDSIPTMKFFLSGSAASPLERGAKTALAGRAFYIKVEPLSFAEFLEMKHGLKDVRGQGVWKDTLPTYFSDYVRRPLPEMVDMQPGLLRKYVRESLVDRIVYRDIPEAHSVDTSLLRDLLQLFYTEVGYTLNVDSLARDLGRSKRTILNAVQYLVDSYAVRLLRNYRPSTLSSSRKLKRVYPYHFCQVSNEETTDPELAECIAASLLDAAYYWREGAREVDFVVGGTPVEVKWKIKLSETDFRNVRYFLEKFDIGTGYILAKREGQAPQVGRGSVLTVPMWKLGLRGRLEAAATGASPGGRQAGKASLKSSP